MVPLRSVRFPPQGTGREAAFIWVGPRGADPAQGFRPRCDSAPAGSAHVHSPASLPWVVPPTTLPQGPGLWPATPTPPNPISGSHCPFIPTHRTRVDLEGATRSLKLPWQTELVCLAGHLLATLSPKPWLSMTHPHTLVLRHSTGPRPQERGGTQFLGSPAGHSQSCIRSGR